MPLFGAGRFGSEPGSEAAPPGAEGVPAGAAPPPGVGTKPFVSTCSSQTFGPSTTRVASMRSPGRRIAITPGSSRTAYAIVIAAM